MEVSKNIRGILGGIIMVIIGIVIIMVLVNMFSKEPEDGSISIEEAQTKCMLMEEADLVNLSGEPFGDATTKEAEKHCLSLWDSPEKESTFKEIIESDWESRKTEVLEGYTLEQLYNESI